MSTATSFVPLPCPFCGQAPRVAHGKVKCTNVACNVQPAIIGWYCKGFEKEAIAEWNCRDAKKGTP